LFELSSLRRRIQSADTAYSTNSLRSHIPPATKHFTSTRNQRVAEDPVSQGRLKVLYQGNKEQ
jgi:hypothetical protein